MSVDPNALLADLGHLRLLAERDHSAQETDTADLIDALRKLWNGLPDEGKRNLCAAWNGGLSRWGDVKVSRERVLFMWRVTVGDDDPEAVAALLDEMCGTGH